MADAEIETAIQTAIDAGKINGAIICATDADGSFSYQKALGERTLLSGDKKPQQLDDVCFMASATKLMATIAALQCVEDGLLSLTGDLSTVAPELGAKQILTGFSDEGEPLLEPQTRGITLEMLLSHSSGLVYHFLDPLVGKWRGKNPIQATNEDGTQRRVPVEEMFNYPLRFQPGSKWMYGPGIDWAGRIVERATGKTLGEFLLERTFKPLGISDAQFFPVTREDLRERLIDLTPDDPDAMGRAVLGGGDDMNGRGVGDFGGHGLFMTAPDYLKVLHSLLSNNSKILQPSTVNTMFEHHLTPSSTTALDEALAGPIGVFFRVGTDPSTKAGFGLGGLLTRQGVDGWYGDRTLTWGGGLTVTWFVDRENGLCGVGGMMARLPMDVQGVSDLKQTFRRDVYRKREAWRKESGLA